jgi:hypothetical protein
MASTKHKEVTRTWLTDCTKPEAPALARTETVRRQMRSCYVGSTNLVGWLQ